MVVQIGDEVRVVGLCGAHKSGANGANGVIVAWRDGEGRVRMTTGSLRDQVIDVSGHNLQRPSHHTMRNMMMHNMLHGSGAPGASSVYPASKGMAIGGRGGVGRGSASDKGTGRLLGGSGRGDGGSSGSASVKGRGGGGGVSAQSHGGRKRKMSTSEALAHCDDGVDAVPALAMAGGNLQYAHEIMMQGSGARVKRAAGLQCGVNALPQMAAPQAAARDPEFQQGLAFGKQIRRAEDLELLDLVHFESLGIDGHLTEPQRWRKPASELAKEAALVTKISSSGKFMSRQAYAKLLSKQGLIELDKSSPHHGQHVFHIISTANGGPNHTDNYLYALGGQFNITIGDKMDHLNCAIAGLAKARKAVAISEQVARDPSLHGHIRTDVPPTLYTKGIHRGKSAEDLVKAGMDIVRNIRHDAR